MISGKCHNFIGFVLWETNREIVCVGKKRRQKEKKGKKGHMMIIYLKLLTPQIETEGQKMNWRNGCDYGSVIQCVWSCANSVPLSLRNEKSFIISKNVIQICLCFHLFIIIVIILLSVTPEWMFPQDIKTNKCESFLQKKEMNEWNEYTVHFWGFQCKAIRIPEKEKQWFLFFSS